MEDDPSGWHNYWQQSLSAPFRGTGLTTETLEGVISTTGTLTEGTREIVLEDSEGRMLSRTRWDVRAGQTVEVDFERVIERDALGRTTKVQTPRGFRSTIFTCCDPSLETNEEGLSIALVHDSLGRLIRRTGPDGTGERFEFDGAGRTLKRWRIASNGSEELMESNGYDAAGRLVSTMDGRNETTQFSEQAAPGGGVQRLTTGPDGTSIIEEFYRDGSLKSRSGTGTHAITRTVQVVDGRMTQTETDATGVLSRSVLDGGGRVLRVETVRGGSTVILQTNTYDVAGRLTKSVDADGVATMQTYTALSRTDLRGIDANGSGSLETDGSDRVTRTTSTVLTRDGKPAQSLVTTAFLTAGPVEVAREDSSVDGTMRWTSSYGVTSSTSVSVDAQNATRTETTSSADGSQTVRHFAAGRLVSETRSDAASSNSLAITYDPFARMATQVSDGVTTAMTYIPGSDLVATEVVTAEGIDARTTSYSYDSSGRVLTTTLPDSSVQENEYFPTGELKRQHGSQTYDVSYTYDAAGRMATLTTTSQAGPGITRWIYSDGQLTAKEYSDGKRTSYTYTPAGHLLTRAWARGITTTYAYNASGELTGMDYSDSTPDVTGMTYDGMGRLVEVVDATGARTLSVAPDGQPGSETWTSGLFAGASVTRTYDSLNRRATLSATGISGASAGAAITYGYESSRLTSVATSDGYAASQAWTADGRHPGSTIHTKGSTTVTMTRTHDALGRLTFAGISGQASTAYEYNALDHRTKATAADGSYFGYSYDDLGQVTSATRHWADDSEVPGEWHSYYYDGAGNAYQRGSGVHGKSFYGINALNQLTGATFYQGQVGITGMADPPSEDASVNVYFNGISATVDRSENGWFYGYGKVNNSAAPLWVQVDLDVRIYDMIIHSMGYQFVPKAQSAFLYDDDGNLTQDARFLYTWDGENRLVTAQTRPEVIAAGVPGVRVTFGYDWMSRRVSKTVEDWQGGTFVPREERVFLYDGWNLLAETRPNGTLLKSYEWGVDLSGTLQGAGGVGGLLRVTDHTGGGSHAVTYDGNGNITALWDLSYGQQSASFRYGPFGEILEATGEAAEVSPFGFSTKYRDAETGLVYYGYRYYHPETGRWVSRDPIEEEGGANLYGFGENNLINLIDPLGLEISEFSKSNIDVDAWLSVKAPYQGIARPFWTEIVAQAKRNLFWWNVKLEGKLKVKIAFAQGINPDTAKDDHGNTVRQHEEKHAWIYGNWWNDFKKEADQFELSFCSEDCAVAASTYVNSASAFYFASADAESVKFDKDVYGHRHPKVLNDYTNAVKKRDKAKQVFDLALEVWKDSGCEKKK